MPHACSAKIRPIRALAGFSSGIALAAVLVGVPVQQARAQSLLGTPTVVGGSATIVTGANTTTVTVDSPSAVIDWLPTDTAIGGPPITFQPAGTTATFTNNAQFNTSFSVLNRILPTDPTRAVQFNGNVVAQVQALSGAPAPGGETYFYSPGGLIIGSTAVFDVGSLGLTTSPIAYNTNGDFIVNGAVNYVQFDPANAGTAVKILSGAQINAPGTSYVLAHAPVVTNDGTINTGRVAALISADASKVTFNLNGLFDIEVSSGTSGTGTTLANNGVITGPVSSGPANRVYMVAVPKNQAISMALSQGSTTGFAIAGAADTVGNAVVLSGGYDVLGGTAAFTPSPGAGTGTVDFNGGDFDATSALSIKVSRDAIMGSGLAAGLDFASDLTVYGPGIISVFSNAGGVVHANGNVSLTSEVFASDPLVTATSGLAELYATDGGSLSVGGTATLSSLAHGAPSFTLGVASGNALAGNAKIQANNGSNISIGGNITLSSIGYGGSSQLPGIAGGDGTVGNAWILSSGTSGSTIATDGGLSIFAQGFGGSGSGCATCSFDGGKGTGGVAAIRAYGGANSVAIAGSVVLDSTGFGGTGLDAAAGTGLGGVSDLTVDSGGSIQLLDATLLSRGFGGDHLGGGTGGVGQGGTAQIGAGTGGGSISIQLDAILKGDGLGGASAGNRFVSSAAKGGTGLGHRALIYSPTDPLVLTIGGNLDVSATGTGGSGNAGDGGDAAGGGASIQYGAGSSMAVTGSGNFVATATGGDSTGSGLGGTASGIRPGFGFLVGAFVSVNNSLVTFGQGLSLNSSSFGGAGIPGNAIASNSGISVLFGGDLQVAGGTSLFSSAQAGSNMTAAASGGSATGGQSFVNLFAANAKFSTTGDLSLSTSALGSAGQGGTSIGGNAQSGIASIVAQSAGQSITIGGNLDMVAAAQGGFTNTTGNGGTATSGNLILAADNGAAISVASALNLDGHATGGDSQGGGTGGAAHTALGRIAVGTGGGGGSINVGSTTRIFTTANGGTGAVGTTGQGGDATASGGSVQAIGGSITLGNNLQINGTATGGNGVLAGGNAIGGDAIVSASAGTITINGSASLFGNGIGGVGSTTTPGSTGGNGKGSLASITAGTPALGANAGSTGNGGSVTITGSAVVNANGQGGAAVTGGAGTGGSAMLGARFGTVTTGNAQISARGIGGIGFLGGNGGDAIGGSAAVLADSDPAGGASVTTGQILALAIATGGQGGTPALATASGGTGGQATGGSVTLAGTAGNGALTVGVVTADARGNGGIGGNGGTSGSGGKGGLGKGGSILIGSRDSTVPTGSPAASNVRIIGDVSANASGQGGRGGIGGTSGGNGGDGQGGSALLSVRGTSVAVGNAVAPGSISLLATGLGGNGQSGTPLGLGGGGFAGQAGPSGIDLASQSGNAAQRGSLSAGSVSIQADAVGGTGSSAGLSTQFNQPLVLNLTNSDAALASLSLSATAGAFVSNAAPSQMLLNNSTLTSQGNFAYQTSGPITVSLNNSLVNVLGTSTASISAFDWVLGSPAASPGVIQTNTGSINLSTAQSILTDASLQTAANSLVVSAPKSLQLGNVVAGNANVTLTAAGGPVTIGAVAAVQFSGSASGNFTSAAITAADAVSIDAGGSLTTGAISASGTATPPTLGIRLVGSGGISTGNLASGRTIGLQSGGAIATGTVTGPDFIALAASGISTGALALTGRGILGNGPAGSLGTAFANTNLSALFAANPQQTAGNLTIAGVGSATQLRMAASGNITTGALGSPSASQISVNAGGVLTTGDLRALSIGMSATGGMSTGNIVAPGIVSLGTGGAMTVGNIIGGGVVALAGGGNASFGNINAVTQPALAALGLIANVHLGASGSIATGVVSTSASVAMSAGQNITATQVLANGSLALLAGQSVSVGSLRSGLQTNPNGSILIASNAMLPLSSLASAGLNLNYAALFNSAPIFAGGGVTISNGMSTAAFSSYAQGNFTAGGLNASSHIDVQSGGLVTVTSRWTSPDINIRSTDIDILAAPVTNPNATVGLSAGATGIINLISLNPVQALIGGGLSGNGYKLDQAELSRVTSGSLGIYAIDNPGQVVDMTIGNLALTGPGAGQNANIADPNGTITFGTATVNGNTPTFSGTIRVNGNLTASGMQDTNYLAFHADTFELDAANGSVSSTGTGTSLGGIVMLDANHIHVAEDAILLRLRSQPFYAGLAAELNRPASVQRPQGVLSAKGLEIYPGQTVYVQNTGSMAVPAGFYSNYGFSDVFTPSSVQPGSIHAIVNGAFEGSSAPITGLAAFQQIVTNTTGGFTNYADDAQVNGCILKTGACQTTSGPADAIASEITALGAQAISEDPTMVIDEQASEQLEEEKQAIEQATAGPIVPPMPLINTRPLAPPARIDEPVAGRGNPALMGSPLSAANMGIQK